MKNDETEQIIVSTEASEQLDAEVDVISCICEKTVDDGLSIACDKCGRWCHAICVEIYSQEEVPEVWQCWKCKPDKKGKRRATTQADGHPKARRRKVTHSTPIAPPVSIPPHPGIGDEDSPIDISSPWEHSYVAINSDVVKDAETRATLRGYRGVTAITSQDAVRTSLRPLLVDPNSIRPPQYSLHTKHPVPSSSYITAYPALITPSSQYIADPLNGYAAMGIPKPHVHLVGLSDPNKALALDARGVGGKARWARSGCDPNAAIRPVVCADDDAMSFGIFALRDLRADDEIVLGWEWDDGHAIHTLPAILNRPDTFPSKIDTEASLHVREQLAGVLQGIRSTFATCACGSKTRTCAIDRMRKFVEHQSLAGTSSFGPLVGQQRGFRTREKIHLSGGFGGVEMVAKSPSSAAPVCPGDDDTVDFDTRLQSKNDELSEESLPHRMRKRTNRAKLSSLRAVNVVSPSASSDTNQTNSPSRLGMHDHDHEDSPTSGMHASVSPPVVPVPKPYMLYALNTLGPTNPSPASAFSMLSLQSPLVGEFERNALSETIPAMRRRDPNTNYAIIYSNPSAIGPTVIPPSALIPRYDNANNPESSGIALKPALPIQSNPSSSVATPIHSPTPAREPTPPPPRPPSPPKVKLSFSEYKARKQKQDQEAAEIAAAAEVVKVLEEHNTPVKHLDTMDVDQEKQEPNKQELDRQEPDRQEPNKQEPDRQEPDRQDGLLAIKSLQAEESVHPKPVSDVYPPLNGVSTSPSPAIVEDNATSRIAVAHSDSFDNVADIPIGGQSHRSSSGVLNHTHHENGDSVNDKAPHKLRWSPDPKNSISLQPSVSEHGTNSNSDKADLPTYTSKHSPLPQSTPKGPAQQYTHRIIPTPTQMAPRTTLPARQPPFQRASSHEDGEILSPPRVPTQPRRFSSVNGLNGQGHRPAPSWSPISQPPPSGPRIMRERDSIHRDHAPLPAREAYGDDRPYYRGNAPSYPRPRGPGHRP